MLSSPFPKDGDRCASAAPKSENPPQRSMSSEKKVYLHLDGSQSIVAYILAALLSLGPSHPKCLSMAHATYVAESEASPGALAWYVWSSRSRQYLEIEAFAASILSLRKGKAEVALCNDLLTNAASLSLNSPNHDCLAQPRSPVETTDATLSPMWKQPPQPDQTYPPTLLWSL
eukprot:TRINITY_DN1398_c0_g1_i4.p1 TRINITY_DN1398_c0_g1~~TRINITY_DN1398_c0_g1_i4.p1  ORF type:complete len:173 (-),score=3.34 TRINITY_DN1398_c0_g1_i4:64-582(-)